MNIRKSILSGMIATSMALGGTAALAQESTPDMEEVYAEASPMSGVTEVRGIPLVDTEGVEIGMVDVWEDEDGGGLWVSINNSTPTSMSDSKLGVHIHESGLCDEELAFETAGDHFNPTDEDHGDINADPSHAGDLGNLEVDGDGNFEHEVLAENLTLESGAENSLIDEDGSVLIIHDDEDDRETQPSGDSGNRWACAIIAPPSGATATPENSGTPVTDETPEASPAG